MEVHSGALWGKPGDGQDRGTCVMHKHSEQVTSNTLGKCNENKMLAWWNTIFTRDPPWLFLLWSINWPKVWFQQTAMKITEHLVMSMVKSIKIFDVSHADFSLSPSLKARYFYQIKILSFYTLINVRQTEFVLLNESFVQSDCVPVLSFSVASGFVNLFSAFLSLCRPCCFAAQL